jgi:branched-subunit amino acid transport protein AzlD
MYFNSNNATLSLPLIITVADNDDRSADGCTSAAQFSSPYNSSSYGERNRDAAISTRNCRCSKNHRSCDVVCPRSVIVTAVSLAVQFNAAFCYLRPMPHPTGLNYASINLAILLFVLAAHFYRKVAVEMELGAAARSVPEIVAALAVILLLWQLLITAFLVATGAIVYMAVTTCIGNVYLLTVPPEEAAGKEYYGGYETDDDDEGNEGDKIMF